MQEHFWLQLNYLKIWDWDVPKAVTIAQDFTRSDFVEISLRCHISIIIHPLKVIPWKTSSSGKMCPGVHCQVISLHRHAVVVPDDSQFFLLLFLVARVLILYSSDVCRGELTFMKAVFEVLRNWGWKFERREVGLICVFGATTLTRVTWTRREEHDCLSIIVVH